MRLELDAGNSRIKWRLWDGRGRFDGGADLKAALQASPKWLPFIEDVWVSSVHEALNAWIINMFPQAKFAQSQAERLGLINGYQQAQSLGVDRWLAMLAAWVKLPQASHIVIDAGTAITLDVIAENGQHMGGYICPGYQMMKSGLLGGTQLVRPDEQWLLGRDLGKNTQQCVDLGIQDMVACWVAHHCQQNPKAVVSVTGGDAQRLLSLLSVNVSHEPDLVLNGLQISFLK